MAHNFRGLVFSFLFILVAGPWAASCVSQTSSMEVASVSSSADCPQSGNKETAEDCPWATIVRDFLQSNQSRDAFEAIIRKWSPRFHESLQMDARNIPAKDLWGWSANYDDNMLAETVNRALLSHLLAWMEAPPLSGPESRIAHAGIEHTYGYMLSNLLTSRGYKRLRWVRGLSEESDQWKGLRRLAPNN